MKTAYYNARVYPGFLPLRDAFLVEDGRILACGDNARILSALSPGDTRVDLEGRFVCPGFNDSHMHLLGYGSSLGWVSLAEHTLSLEDLLAHTAAFLSAHPRKEGQWLLGRGWNQDYFTDVRRMPDRHDLDRISDRVPVLLIRACGHCAVLNTPALRLAGIGPGTRSPAGGDIGHEADGAPDGRLYDNAMELYKHALPVPGRAEIRAMLLSACAAANRYGLTSVQSDDFLSLPGVPWQTVDAVYREMAVQGELTLRVTEQAQFQDAAALKAFLDAGHRTGDGDERYRLGPVKIVADGSLGSRTAHLSIPYADAPGTRGFSLYSREALFEMVSLAHGMGMQLAVHAIGDACLDQVLDALAAALREHPRPDHRHGIVHCQITRPDQLRRIREMELHVFAQSIFLDYDTRIVRQRVGTELAASSYSWKTLLQEGVSVSNGSDCPVEKPDVLAGIQCAVTRAPLQGGAPYLPGEAFTVAEALDSFTLRGAEASFEEGFKGRIAPGYLADFYRP